MVESDSTSNQRPGIAIPGRYTDSQALHRSGHHRFAHPAFGEARVDRQANRDAPAAVGVGHEVPVRDHGDRLVDELKATFALTDGLDGIGPDRGGTIEGEADVDP